MTNENTADESEQILELKEIIVSQQEEILKLQEELAQAMNDNAIISNGTDSLSKKELSCASCAEKDAAITALQRELDVMTGKVTSVEKEQEDLLVYLADQDAEMKRMRARLRELGEDIPASDIEDE